MEAAPGNIIIAEMQAMTARDSSVMSSHPSNEPPQPPRASVLQHNSVNRCFLDKPTCSTQWLLRTRPSPVGRGSRFGPLPGRIADWTTKSSSEQRSISSWVCFPILLPSGQTQLPLENRCNGGSDHQVMALPCRRE